MPRGRSHTSQHLTLATGGLAVLFAVACGKDTLTGESRGDLNCQPSPNITQDSSAYALSVDASQENVGQGMVTRWDPNLRLVVLGPEPPTPGPDSLSSPELGFNMWLRDVFSGSEGLCGAFVERAELVTADQRAGSPDEINARFFETFSNEDGATTRCGSGDGVADLILRAYGDGHIAASQFCAKMRETIYTPSGEQPFTYGEPFDLNGVFVAVNR